jgi:hypothetical protein
MLLNPCHLCSGFHKPGTAAKIEKYTQQKPDSSVFTKIPNVEVKKGSLQKNSAKYEFLSSFLYYSSKDHADVGFKKFPD